MEEKKIQLTETETKELREIRDRIFHASVGYIEADKAKMAEGRKYEEAGREFSEMINSKIKMSGLKNEVVTFFPDLDNSQIIINPEKKE